MADAPRENERRRSIIYLIRHHIGRHLYYLGFRIQPASHRRGLACMSALGIAWAKSNEDDLLKVMRGELVIEWQWNPSPPQDKP